MDNISSNEWILTDPNKINELEGVQVCNQDQDGDQSVA